MMEVDPLELTEDFILALTSAKRLSFVQELDISDQNITELDWSLISKLTTLQTLNLSSNNIAKIPNSLKLCMLVSLDVSDNNLSSIEFTEQFPHLEELYMKGNNFELSDQYIALECCPRLRMIDGQTSCLIKDQMTNIRNKLQTQFDAVWEELYEDAFPDGIPHQQMCKIINNLVNRVTEIEPKCMTNIKFRDFLIHRLASQMVIDISSGLYKSQSQITNNILQESNTQCSPRKRHSLVKIESPTKRLASPVKYLCSSTRSLQNSPAKLPMNHARHLVVPFTKIQSPTQLIHGSPSKMSPKVSVKPVGKTPVKEYKFCKGSNQQKEGSISLTTISDYDPVHFIRCHFGDREAKRQNCGLNDPKDEFTKVWQCAFEPHPREKDGETGIVASCGGSMVCMIDCSTGQVMKRFKQEGQQFYSLAWTTLAIEAKHEDSVVERPTNILAVGGYNAHICLLHPDQFLCYKEWGTGVPNKSVRQGTYYISALVFHPDKPTWLFAGASDETVTLLDIGIPSGPKHNTDIRKLLVFNSTYEILNLAISSKTSHLVAGCDGGIVAWKIPNEEVKKSCSRRQVNMELLLPLDDAVVDGLTLITADIIACKCVEDSCIYAWNLTETLSKSKHNMVDVKPLLTMEWKYTKEKFIQLGSKNGTLSCGDDLGNIWLYNLKSILKRPHALSQEMYRPSRILLWPACDINTNNAQEKKMTDVLDKPHAKPLIVNNVSVSATGEYIVAVTDNNLVCVWKDVNN